MGVETSDIEVSKDATIHGFQWFLVCTALYALGINYGLDATIAADVQVAVIKTFGNVEQITWLGTGFPLGSVCVILPLASFYAVLDIKALFISSIVLFEVGSALCGASPNMNALIVGRVLTGVGGAGLYIGLLNYITLLTTALERGRYMSGIGLVWGVGAILGPVVGGAFSSSAATWRWGFYINLVLAAICAPVFFLYLPSATLPQDANTSTLGKLRRMDWIGFLLSTATIVGFTLVLTFAGTAWAWSDSRTIATFVVSGLLFILTILQQSFLLFTTAETRMTPATHLLRNRSLALAGLETFAAAMNIFVPLYYIPLYFQLVHGDTAIKAAVRLLPFVMILVSANIASGALLLRINYYWLMYLASGILMTTGGALMTTITSSSPAAALYGYSVILALGTGLTFNIGYSVAGIKAATKQEWSGKDVQDAVSLQNCAQIGGTLFCLLVLGQVFQSFAYQNLRAVLGGQGFSEAQIRSAVAGTQSALFGRLGEGLREAATRAITEAVRKVYWLSVAAGVLSVVCALGMKKERLFQAAVVEEI
ncbi:MFS general substrate transporter [Mytilinidion resinicola]|uniref:MFS general substrate transporter n=1 Tax=Mytilinidion resinicola TaxID=574789 RepID=A0A6A6Y0V4_9PEZI|nr:MFS general substrate transporter [Mytilinidion resinicola]KAF2802153.1 MFS general substrate transporter [Mytilinidion resinicola]